MNNNLEQILAELYQSDPSLKQHDQALRKLVVELMEVKPNTQFDEQFRQDLRRKLMVLSEKQENNQSLISNFMKKFQLVGAGAALMALLIVSAWYLNGVNKTSQTNLTTMLSGPKITKISANAFGSLGNLQEGGRGSGGGNASAMSEASSGSLTVAPDVAVGTGTDAKMIAPVQDVNYRYVYTGEALTLTEGQLEVLKRDKDQSSSNVADFINQASMGLINLNSFDNSELQSFNFAEDKDLGYMVNVSLSEGTININEHYPKWQALYMPCMDSLSSTQALSCAPQPRVNISEVPADQVVIDATNAFLAEHSIPTSIYGTPFVNSDWRVQYERAANKSDVWIPDVINVVYPLVIDGQPVFDESGNPNGMNVSVRFKPEVKVSSVYELTSQNYQSSLYAAETSIDRVMALVEKGGFRNYYYSDANAKTTIEIELGTPQISYVKLWNYANNANEELLVPALIFPVTKEPTEPEAYYWYRKNIVIPLVKEILDNENGDLPIRIMPAAGGATEPAVMEDAVR